MPLPITMTEEVLQRLPESDLRAMHAMLHEAESDHGPYRDDWRRLLERVEAELGRRHRAAPRLRLVTDEDG